jgi:CDGSH-type Zn-finger protein
MTGPVVAQTSPYKVLLKAGQNYAWCSCGLSAKQPFCDGTHKQTENLKPIVFAAENDETVFLCGCKQTKNSPRCDGTHSTL